MNKAEWRKCSSCGRRIKPGHEILVDDCAYGTLCYARLCNPALIKQPRVRPIKQRVEDEPQDAFV